MYPRAGSLVDRCSATPCLTAPHFNGKLGALGEQSAGATGPVLGALPERLPPKSGCLSSDQGLELERNRIVCGAATGARFPRIADQRRLAELDRNRDERFIGNTDEHEQETNSILVVSTQLFLMFLLERRRVPAVTKDDHHLNCSSRLDEARLDLPNDLGE